MSKIMLAAMILVLLLGGYNLHVHPDDPMSALAFGYGVFYFSGILMILPHEIAHALAGGLVGFKPVAILVGEAPLLFDREVLGVRVRIGRWPRCGAACLDLREVPAFNARAIFAFAAGGLLHLVLGGAALWAARYVPANEMSTFWRVVVLGFAVANLSIALVTFWPRTVRTPMGETVSDGALILARLVNMPMPWGAQRFSVHLLKATLAYHDRDFPSVIRETEQAESFCEDPDLRAQSSALRAEALSESGAARAAVDLLTPFLSRSDLSDAMRSHIDQAYVWAVLLCDESGLFDDALARIERCVRRMPWVDVYIIKRACLLIASAATDPQRIPEARSLVDSLKAFSLHGESLAYAALARGLVAAAEGRAAEARSEYALARKRGVAPASLRLLDRRLAAG